MMRVLILAAMPQEVGPLLGPLGRPHIVARSPYPTWVGRVGHTECHVVQTGIGREHAGRAAAHVLDSTPVDLVISTGFAGSLCPGLDLGRVVWARNVATLVGEDGDGAGDGDGAMTGSRDRVPPPFPAFCRTHAVQPARFLTVDGVHAKAGLIERYADTPTVLDMESAAVAAAARVRRVPFVGLRAISDTWEQEIDWLPASVLDESGTLRAGRVAGAVFRRPRVLVSLVQLQRGARIAGRSLAATLSTLLRLPEEELRETAARLQPEP